MKLICPGHIVSSKGDFQFTECSAQNEPKIVIKFSQNDDF